MNAGAAEDVFKMPALPVKKKSKAQQVAEAAGPPVLGGLVDYGADSDEDSD